MNERDELARIIMVPEGFDGGPASCGPNDVYAARTADAILAAGYSKPRTITTAEELDALNRGCIVRSDSGELWEKYANSWDNLSESGEHSYWASEVALPATVLWEPK